MQSRDLTCQELIKCITPGYWESLEHTDFFRENLNNYRHNLVYNHGVILKDTRFYIPYELRKNILHLIHQGHFGEVNLELVSVYGGQE